MRIIFENRASNLSWGFGYTMLTPGNKMLHSPFTCKDYIQDFFYLEKVKPDYRATFGGNAWEPGMLIPSKNGYYKVMISSPVEKLEERIPHMEYLINLFDKALGIPKTKVYKTQLKTAIVVKFHERWSENGPLLSSLMTIIRVSGMYKAEEDFIEYLKNLDSEYSKNSNLPYESSSKYPPSVRRELCRIHSYIKKLAALLQGKKPDYSWDKLKKGESHSMGIMGYSGFPTVEV